MLKGARFLTPLLFFTAVNANAVTIIHTNDLLGELEPCGCRTNPLGGVVREENFLKKLGEPSLILVDGGDLLFATNPIPDILKKQSELQATFLLQALDKLHYDASVPGEKDFALGFKTFQKLRKKTKIAFLGANVKGFQPNLVVKRKDKNGKTIRVGIFGLMGKGVDYPKEIKVTDPIAAAKAQVTELKKKSDFIVALTHEGLDADKILAQKVHGIDIIIGGHSQSFLQEPQKVGSTWIYQSSFRNQYVGSIPVVIPFKNENYQLTALDAGYDSPADAPSGMDDLVKNFKKGIADLNVAEAHDESLAPENRRVASYQTFPKCAECHLKQFDFWRKTNHANALEPLVSKDQIANKECLSCHTVGLGKPNGYIDVTKLADLKSDDKTVEFPVNDFVQFMKSVHTADTLHSMVKFHPSDPEGVQLQQALNHVGHAWGSVQCENCHQAGGDHPFNGTIVKTVETSTCLSCHNQERAPEWYLPSGQPDLKKIEAKRAMVTCPAGELPPEE